LSPFDAAPQTLMASYLVASEDPDPNFNWEGDVLIYPNPMSSNEVTISVQGTQSTLTPGNAFVEITGATGLKAFREEITCSQCQEIEIRLDRNLTPGMYMVHGVINGRKFIKRLVVL
jgi:hypothetical protein